jgi:hypothetical protein
MLRFRFYSGECWLSAFCSLRENGQEKVALFATMSGTNRGGKRQGAGRPNNSSQAALPGQPLLLFAAGLPRRHAKALTVEAARAKRDEEALCLYGMASSFGTKKKRKLQPAKKRSSLSSTGPGNVGGI